LAAGNAQGYTVTNRHQGPIMARVLTECPRVSSPCPQLPTFARGQKSVFCDLCQKRVHNLSAMSARERESLLADSGPLCVRYAYLLPAAALLLASQSALAQVVHRPLSGWMLAQLPAKKAVRLSQPFQEDAG